jgi:roadblock/LC7 domain-containing protein
MATPKYLLSQSLLDQIRDDHRRVKQAESSPNATARRYKTAPKESRYHARITGKYIAGTYVYYPAEATYSAIQVITDSNGDYQDATSPIVWGDDADSGTLPPLIDMVSVGPYNIDDTLLQRIPNGTVVEVFSRGREDYGIQWYCEAPEQYKQVDFGAEFIYDGARKIRIKGGQVLFEGQTATTTDLTVALETPGYIYVRTVLTNGGSGITFSAPVLEYKSSVQSAYTLSSANVLTRNVLIGTIDSDLWTQAHTGAINMEPPVNWVREQGKWCSVTSGSGPSYTVTMLDQPLSTLTAAEANGQIGIPGSDVIKVWVTFKSDGTALFEYTTTITGGMVDGDDDDYDTDTDVPIAADSTGGGGTAQLYAQLDQITGWNASAIQSLWNINGVLTWLTAIEIEDALKDLDGYTADTDEYLKHEGSTNNIEWQTS